VVIVLLDITLAGIQKGLRVKRLVIRFVSRKNNVPTRLSPREAVAQDIVEILAL